jgi:hypothetical protein
MSTTILAVDLGKFISVLWWYDPATRAAAFRSVRTAHEELGQELIRQPVGQVVFEVCAQAGWVHDLCEELRLAALVASTTGAAWQWKRVKRKTDRDDALKLARLAAVGEIDGVPVPPRAMTTTAWTIERQVHFLQARHGRGKRLRLDDLLRSGAIANYAELARLGHVTRAARATLGWSVAVNPE